MLRNNSPCRGVPVPPGNCEVCATGKGVDYILHRSPATDPVNSSPGECGVGGYSDSISDCPPELPEATPWSRTDTGSPFFGGMDGGSTEELSKRRASCAAQGQEGRQVKPVAHESPSMASFRPDPKIEEA